MSDNENPTGDTEETPEAEVPAGCDDDAPHVRRSDGPRKNISERVLFHFADRTLDGWALNMSRGGLRAIVEEPVVMGEEFELTVGDNDERRAARIVWVRGDADGAVVGISFVGSPFSSVPPPPSPESSDPEPEG